MIKPNLAAGVEITGNLLLKLSGQGSVYIRSYESLENDSDCESPPLSPNISGDDDAPDYIPNIAHSETISYSQQHKAVSPEDLSKQSDVDENQQSVARNTVTSNFSGMYDLFTEENDFFPSFEGPSLVQENETQAFGTQG